MGYKIFVFSLFVGFSGLIYSQDPIANKILEHVTTNEYVTKGRSLLWESMKSDDKEIVEKVFFNLLEKELDTRKSFAFIEKVLLCYYLGNYDLVFDHLSHFSEEQYYETEPYRHGILPTPDELSFGIKKLILDQSQTLINAIYHSHETNEHKDFLTMHLKKTIYDGNIWPLNSSNEINILADKFILDYPDSPFKAYVSRNFRNVLIKSKWAIDIDYFAGVSLLEPELGDYFEDFASIGFSLGVFYKKFQFSFKEHIGGSTTKDSIFFTEGYWKEESKTNVFMPELSFGYVIYDGSALKIIPHVGIASTRFKTSFKDQEDYEYYEYYEDIGLKFTTTYTTGVTFDFKFRNYDGPPKYLHGFGNGFETNGFFRVRYNYVVPRFHERYNRFGGNMHTITIGFGAFKRNYVRDDGFYPVDTRPRHLHSY